MKKEVFNKLATLSTAAFGLVAALAWNEAIQTIFKKFFGARGQITSMVLYAVFVTLIAVMVTIWIGRVADKVK